MAPRIIDSFFAIASAWLQEVQHEELPLRIRADAAFDAGERQDGYARNRHSVSNAKELVFENNAFQWACVVEL